MQNIYMMLWTSYASDDFFRYLYYLLLLTVYSIIQKLPYEDNKITKDPRFFFLPRILLNIALVLQMTQNTAPEDGVWQSLSSVLHFFCDMSTGGPISTATTSYVLDTQKTLPN